MDRLFGIPLEELYWNLKVGRSKRKASVYTVMNNLSENIKQPVFFLSTGRCGTKWFSDVLSFNKDLMVLHNPIPSLARQSKEVFWLFKNATNNELKMKMAQEIFLTGREQYLRFSYKSDKRYIETNNYITFFAPILAEIFPDSRFVHLYRHPADFVRSGIRRGYYQPGNEDDIKRIIPSDSNEDWQSYSRVEKVGWLWNQTNSFIEQFKSTTKADYMNFNFNSLSLASVKELFNFLNLEIPENKIEKLLNQKSNVQKHGDFPEYNQWTDQQKSDLKNVCLHLATKYGYQL